MNSWFPPQTFTPDLSYLIYFFRVRGQRIYCAERGFPTTFCTRPRNTRRSGWSSTSPSSTGGSGRNWASEKRNPPSRPEQGQSESEPDGGRGGPVRRFCPACRAGYRNAPPDVQVGRWAITCAMISGRVPLPVSICTASGAGADWRASRSSRSLSAASTLSRS